MSDSWEGYIKGGAASYWAGVDSAASGILPICVRTARICLAWRSTHVHEGNCWSTIGGANKPSLSPEDNARRELQEETGFFGRITLRPAYVYADGDFRYHNFLGLVDEEFEIAESVTRWEVTALRWSHFHMIIGTMRRRPQLFHIGLHKLFSSAEQLIAGCVTSCKDTRQTVDIPEHRDPNL
jgi:8-oxo-dGTP pyrophosphatase MutT (NUDIX family)